MGKQLCSICASPVDVVAAIDAALYAGETGRAIAARSAFSKSAIYRHREKCLPREAVRQHRDKFLASQTPGRIIVRWPEGYEPPLTTVTRGKCVPFDETLGPNDVIVEVHYESVPIHEVGNPRALVNDRLIAEATAEYREKFPHAVIAES